MNLLPDDQLRALRVLSACWPVAPPVLIGATALHCRLNAANRPTHDLDLAVGVEVLDVTKTMQALKDWTSEPGHDHRWRSPEGVPVDILPMADDLLDRGHIVWSDGSSMSLVGFRHLRVESDVMPVGDDVSFTVARLPIITLLKIVSFLDRPADRTRDLGDIAFILENHGSQERRFAEASGQSDVVAETAGAFLLGRDLGPLLDAVESQRLTAFIERVLGVDDGGTTERRMTNAAPRIWREEPDRARQMMRALRSGLR